MAGSGKTTQESRLLAVPKVGCVRFDKSRRAKRLSVSVRPDRSVRVAVPRAVSQAAAIEFLESHIPWVQKQLAKCEQYRRQVPLSALSDADRKRARAALIERLEYLADKYGFIYNRVFIRNQRTRWGSCSARKNINLNIALAFLPQHLQDFVLLHELMHTVHANHSREFWHALEQIVGDTEVLRRQMRPYSPGLL
mgnify:FL=1